MNVSGFIAVGLGGAIGCWLRWIFSALLNPLFPNLPLGTLLANLLGGLAMGCLMAVFEHFQSLPPEWRLFALTGFLGGLTTFSTFSAEAGGLLLRQQYLWLGFHVAVHLLGSLSLTILGIVAMRSLLRA